jgi:murein DD-endopeptidase MepM/ murein hydrolase activator NlpD
LPLFFLYRILIDAMDAKENKVKSLQNEKSSLAAKNADLEKQAQAAKQKEIEETAKLLAASNYSGNFSGKFTWPVPGVYIVTAMFFDKEYLTLTGINHTGFDIGASQGHNVVAMEDGVVIKADYMAGGYGNYVVINHGASSDGYTYATLYGHNSALCVKKGDIVTKGQKIAISGNTGFSSAAHVHIEVIKAKGSANWVVDGMDYFNASQAPFTYQSYGKVISYPFENESQYQYKKISTRSTIVQ